MQGAQNPPPERAELRQRAFRGWRRGCGDHPHTLRWETIYSNTGPPRCPKSRPPLLTLLFFPARRQTQHSHDTKANTNHGYRKARFYTAPMATAAPVVAAPGGVGIAAVDRRRSVHLLSCNPGSCSKACDRANRRLYKVCEAVVCLSSAVVVGGRSAR